MSVKSPDVWLEQMESTFINPAGTGYEAKLQTLAVESHRIQVCQPLNNILSHGHIITLFMGFTSEYDVVLLHDIIQVGKTHNKVPGKPSRRSVTLPWLAGGAKCLLGRSTVGRVALKHMSYIFWSSCQTRSF